MMDKVQKIHEAVEKRYECWKEKESNSHSIESEIRMSECKHLLLMLNSLQEEPVSEDLISVAKQYIDSHVFGNEEDKFTRSVLVDMFCSGAKWQKEQMMEKGIETIFNVSLPSGLYDKLWVKGCKEGDKLLVIKKDEL